MRERTYSIGLVVVTLTAILILRVYLSGQGEYQAGLEALSKNALEQAVTHFQRAIKWYLPGASYVELAADRLAFAGMEARKRGNLNLALEAFYELKAGFQSARGLYKPGHHWINVADRAIDQIWEEKGKGRVRPIEGKEKVVWGILTELGFFGWVASTLGLIWKGYTEQGEISWRRALPWGFALVLGYGLWVVAMGQV